MQESKKHISIWKVQEGKKAAQEDVVAIEEPVEIRLAFGPNEKRAQKSISITMRTPGHDIDLARGFLFTEGIINSNDQIKDIKHLDSWNPQAKDNIVLVELKEEVVIDFQRLERHFYTSSSCGVCGKSSIDAVYASGTPTLVKNNPIFSADLIHQLPELLGNRQSIFKDTGGLHAAALFDVNGHIQITREDVGRHNAVDKLIGAALEKGLIPLNNFLILVSGRASFELIQKSLMAGIPILAAVGAPSSLAIQLATDSDMTVLGFVRNNRYNIYSHPERIS